MLRTVRPPFAFRHSARLQSLDSRFPGRSWPTAQYRIPHPRLDEPDSACTLLAGPAPPPPNNGDGTLHNPQRGLKSALSGQISLLTWVYLIVSRAPKTLQQT